MKLDENRKKMYPYTVKYRTEAGWATYKTFDNLNNIEAFLKKINAIEWHIT